MSDEEREIQNEWIAEAERRLDEMRSGKVKGIPYEKVVADVRAKLDANRVKRQRTGTGID
jgi:putative addiction module component (TIGR02574 family)